MDEDTIARQVGALVSLIERRQEAAGAAGGAAPGPFTLVMLEIPYPLSQNNHPKDKGFFRFFQSFKLI